MDALDLLTGLFRRFRRFVLRCDVEIVGQCRMCGECCRNILIRDRRWLRTEQEFRELCEREPEHKRFVIDGEDDKGRLVFNCSMQGEDNFCTCYENRLPLCRNYPAKSIYYEGGWIRSDCGFRFKSTSFRDILRRRQSITPRKFSDVLTQEIKRTDD